MVTHHNFEMSSSTRQDIYVSEIRRQSHGRVYDDLQYNHAASTRSILLVPDMPCTYRCLRTGYVFAVCYPSQRNPIFESSASNLNSARLESANLGYLIARLPVKACWIPQSFLLCGSLSRSIIGSSRAGRSGWPRSWVIFFYFYFIVNKSCPSRERQMVVKRKPGPDPVKMHECVYSCKGWPNPELLVYQCCKGARKMWGKGGGAEG